MPGDKWDQYAKPAETKDKWDQYAVPAPATAQAAAAPPEQPGFFSRLQHAVMDPIGSHFDRYNQEAQKLRDRATGPPTIEQSKHPIANFVNRTLAGTEADVADQLTPMFAATVGGARAAQLPGRAGKLAKAAMTTGGAGLIPKGASDIWNAGTETTPEAWGQRLGGAAEVAGGTAAVMPAVMSAASHVPKARESLRKKVYQELPGPLDKPVPTLTPGAARTSRGVGGVTGAAIGAALSPESYHLGALPGMYVGKDLGPLILQKVAGTPPLGDIHHPGPFAKIPIRVPVEVEPVAPAEPQSAYQQYYADKKPAKPYTASSRPPDLESFAQPVRAATPNRAMQNVLAPESPGLPKVNLAGNETVAKPSRTMVLTPQEAAAEGQMHKLATRRASERGMQFAGGMVPREGRSVPKIPTRMQSTTYPAPREVVSEEELVKPLKKKE